VKTEIITIGEELLKGVRANTNAAFLGERLTGMGAVVTRSATVADDSAAIESELAAAMERSDLVVTTGGLGVTADDRTRRAVARVLGTKLVLDEDVLKGIRTRFESRGRQMPEINVSQAMVPEGARTIANRRGTAPGLVFEREGTLVFALPGPPSELRAMFTSFVAPYLEGAGLRRLVHERILRTTGLPESEIAGRIGPIAKRLARTDVAYLPSVRGVDLRITGRGSTAEEAAITADSSLEKIASRLEPFVYATGPDTLEKVVGYTLAMRGATVCVAESCTGGGLGRSITRVPGSSEYFKGGVIAYSDELKKRLLKVKATTLKTHGAVSEQTAREMAAGARAACRADFGLAVTGIAGPGGGTDEKPIGTVHIAVAGPDSVRHRHYRFAGGRSAVRAGATQAALELLRRTLMEIADD
jgi:nicotinamide-nucleotide amidase